MNEPKILRPGMLLFEDGRKVLYPDEKPYLLLERYESDHPELDYRYRWRCLFGDNVQSVNGKFLEECCDFKPHKRDREGRDVSELP